MSMNCKLVQRKSRFCIIMMFPTSFYNPRIGLVNLAAYKGKELKG